MINTLKDNVLTRYFRETGAELKKVRWPTWQEARNLTFIVLGATFVMALLLGSLDFVLAREFEGLISLNPVALVIAGVGLLGIVVSIVVGIRRQ